MKSKTLILTIGYIVGFYVIGTAVAVILLNLFDYTFVQVSYVFLVMSISSFILGAYYIYKLTQDIGNLTNSLILTVLILMAVLLLFFFFSMRTPWELSIF